VLSAAVSRTKIPVVSKKMSQLSKKFKKVLIKNSLKVPGAFCGQI
jgi:hypothetical protein